MTSHDSGTARNRTIDARTLVGDTARSFEASWKSLVLTDLAYKIIAFVVLTPLVGVLFRLLIATSGDSVLSDMDIVLFFLGPVGWLCFILVGALSLGIVALEQASLIGIVCAREADKRLGLLDALRFAFANAWPVAKVTARMVVLTLLTAAPFLGILAAAYFALLTKHDINFYLDEKPPVFVAAVGIAGVLVTVLVAVLLRLFTGWFFALPLVLFENMSPANSLRVSKLRAHGRRRTLLQWIVGWAVASALLSGLATGTVGLLARLVIPDSPDSIHFLAIAIGLILLILVVVNLVLNLFSSTAFATILFHLYSSLGRGGNSDSLVVDIAENASESGHIRITARRLVAAGILGLVIAIVIGGAALQTVGMNDNVKIMAHRGSSKAAPENTIAAFRKAIEDGADWVELDVQETADGEVVVFHDSDFMRLANNDLKIWDATTKDLKDIDIGSSFTPEFHAERVPTLAQVLDECKGKIRVNIELKYYGHDEQLEQRVADIVDSYGMASDVVAMSLKRESVKKMKEVRPGWKVGLLMSVSAGDLSQVEADFIAVNAGFVSRRLIRTAHKNGKEVYVWTVDDPVAMSTMIGRGVDALLTNKPALAKSVLQQRAQMSVPERLLLELAGMFGKTSEIGEI